MRSELKRKMTSRSSELEKKREAQTQKLKMGLANTRLGRHKIQPGNIDVQLGEELSESLRAMKVRTLCDDLNRADIYRPFSPRATFSETDSSAYSTVLWPSLGFPYCMCSFLFYCCYH